MRIENYAWQYYTGMYYNNTGSDIVVAYITDQTHTPPQWQENLGGASKDQAREIVLQDRADAYAQPGDSGYYQSTINEEKRWYLRTSKLTGNSWEEVLDESGKVEPIPGYDSMPPVVSKRIDNAKVTVRMVGSRMIMTVTGTITQ